MEIKRRDFLKGAAVGGLLLAADIPSVLAEPRKGLPPDALGILYDATLCVGCKACVSSCKQYNNLPAEHTIESRIYDDPVDLSGKTLNIIKLYTQGSGAVKDRERDGFSFVKRQCMHCVDPSCVSACPVSALKKDPKNGIVGYNRDACLGCRYCQIACPYNVPKFEWDNPFPQIRKCQLCSHRIREGKIAACCEFCPTGASLFGKVADLREEANRRLWMKPGRYYDFPTATVTSSSTVSRPAEKYHPRIYGEKEGGGTQVLLLSAVPFEMLGLPKLPVTSDASRSESVQHGIYKGMIAPLALLGVLLAAAYRSGRSHHKDDE